MRGRNADEQRHTHTKKTRSPTTWESELSLLFRTGRGVCGGLGLGLNRNNAAVALTALEHHHTVGEGEERVVAAHTYVFAGIVDRAALANDDVAGDASLATPDLNTQTL